MKEHLVIVDELSDGRLLLRVFSETADGLDVADGPPRILPPDCDTPTLGATVVEALYRSNTRQLPTRNPRDDGFLPTFLASIGAKSYRHYMKGTRSVGLRAEFDANLESVRIVPKRNEGVRGGFTPITHEKVVVPYESPEQLGRAVQEAMKKATR